MPHPIILPAEFCKGKTEGRGSKQSYTPELLKQEDREVGEGRLSWAICPNGPASTIHLPISSPSLQFYTHLSLGQLTLGWLLSRFAKAHVLNGLKPHAAENLNVVFLQNRFGDPNLQGGADFLTIKEIKFRILPKLSVSLNAPKWCIQGGRWTQVSMIAHAYLFWLNHLPMVSECTCMFHI